MDWEEEDSGVEDASNGEDIEDFDVFNLVDDQHHYCYEQCEEKHKIKSKDDPHYSGN